MAKLCCCYDVLNQLCLWTSLDSWAKAEHHTAIEHMDQSPEKVLLIYDRHFPSFECFYAHYRANKDFLMRIQSNFRMVKHFVESGLSSKIFAYKITYNQINPLRAKGYQVNKDSVLPVRLIRVELDSGEIEVLVTSLMDDKLYPSACFKELYNLRWGVETFFERVKHKMALESFAGYKPICIRQEVFAHIFVANLQSLMVSAAKEDYDKKSTKTKYRYQPNYQFALGLIKQKILDLFRKNSLGEALEFIHQYLRKTLEPVRKGRTFPRITSTTAKHVKHKTFFNFKPVL